MRLFFQASVSDCSNPRLCLLLLCIIPIPSSFPNSCHSLHTGSSAHLRFPCRRLIISYCRTGSFVHLGATHICPRIIITHPDFLSLPVVVLLYAHFPTAPTPSFSFPQVFQGGLKLFFCRLLAPPHLPTQSIVIKVLCF